jgi:hypothetical protein
MATVTRSSRIFEPLGMARGVTGALRSPGMSESDLDEIRLLDLHKVSAATGHSESCRSIIRSCTRIIVRQQV